MITCLIVDDNDLSRLTLHQQALQTGRLRITGECKDAIEAHRNITANPPDLVFLDIEMPGMTGIDLLKILPKQTLAILTTSKKDYAVEAFDLNVVDYLIKPVNLPRLLQAIDKVQDILSRNEEEITAAPDEYIFIRDNNLLKKLRLEEILWIEAMGDYVKIRTEAQWHIVHTTLKAVEEKINSARLMRVHRSYIISLDKIDSIEDGAVNIINTPIPVAESYRAKLIQKIKLL
ncbi:DNA-binding response regulator [Niastella yeongjuensis]|uniref:DNA-binding response regulator n=1 Tax=Niastella yeongjuensis TaxID=354355 RepID=A0A1V9E153_9BACT|nr:LytTR family DNA-binding domain-containing protein [Niastella yeongjuensis]OQP39858.1 DNA-binding response regulator [Niastella yeongjuensis]SEO07951.1 two component transcriptional regulator, LytTR family [Niastella yeongjuensis]